MEVLEKFFSFEKEDKALDFMYKHLDEVLTGGKYELVDSYLRAILDNEIWWKKGIEQPIFSLAFTTYIFHEPQKFKNRKEYVEKLAIDYAIRHGQVRADGLLRGLRDKL